MYRLLSEKLHHGVLSFRSLLARRRSNGCSLSNKRKRTSVDYQLLEHRQVLSANFPAYVNGQLTLGDSTADAPYALADTFKLESNPDSSKSVFLDFTGHQSTNNSWNHSIQFPAYNTAGSNTTFTKSELIEIQKIFQNVAEDFLPLDVNVTTRYPGVEALKRSSPSDQQYGIRVVVTQQTGDFGVGTGGLAKRNSFIDHRDTPAFVFNKGVNNAAWTISHEAGHTMGLTHDGLNEKDYHSGVGNGLTSWGPIMGGPFGKSLTQWSDGSYEGANNRQDDLSVMTRTAMGIQLRPDDVGNSIGSADPLQRDGNQFEDWGTITSRTDVDYYEFSVEDSEVNIVIKPFQGQGNLDIVAKLYSSNGKLLATSNPADALSAKFDQRLTKGSYYLAIDGAGLEGRYTDYGSLGFYSVQGRVTPVEPVVEMAANTVGESGHVSTVDHQWRTVQLQGRFNDPVVIVGPATSNGNTAGVVQVRNVQSTSFEIRIEDWGDSAAMLTAESVGYVVVEAGKHDLSDGRRLVAGNGYVSDEARRIGFGEYFEEPPVVLAQAISERGESSVKTRVSAVNSGGFGIMLQKGGAKNSTHHFERFSFLAIDASGEDDFDFVTSAGEMVGPELRTLRGAEKLGVGAVFLAHTQSQNGDTPGNLRLKKSVAGDLSIYFQKEETPEQEGTQITEQLGYLVMRPGLLVAQDQQAVRNQAVDEVFGDEPFRSDRIRLDFAELDRFQDKSQAGK